MKVLVLWEHSGEAAFAENLANVLALQGGHLAANAHVNGHEITICFTNNALPEVRTLAAASDTVQQPRSTGETHRALMLAQRPIHFGREEDCAECFASRAATNVWDVI